MTQHRWYRGMAVLLAAAIAAFIAGCSSESPDAAAATSTMPRRFASLPAGAGPPLAVVSPGNDSNAPGPSPAGSPNAQRADAFVDALGINVHFGYGDTVYRYLTSPAPSGNTILGALKALGIRHIRDGGIDNRPELCSAYQTVIANGTDVDAIVDTRTDSIALRKIQTCLGAGLFALEGPNELDTSGKSDWAQLDVNEMQVLQANRGVTFCSNVKLFGPSTVSERAYVALAAVNGDALAGALDDANVHIYFSAREPETRGWGGTDRYGTYGDIRTARNWAVQIAAPGKPWVSTETGYPDTVADNAYVTPSVKTKYLVRDLLRHWQDGAQKTYVYELAQENGSWGLMDQNLYPKPAFHALQNLIAILKDPGPPIAAGYLGYSLQANADVEHLLFAKRDGSYWLCIWQNDQSWNPSRNRPIDVTPTTATIHFGAAPSMLERYQLNPNDGSVTANRITAAATVSIPVSDSPEFIAIRTTAADLRSRRFP